MKGNLFVFNHKPKFINFTQINIHLSKHHKLPNKYAHEPYLGLVKIYKYVKPPPPPSLLARLWKCVKIYQIPHAHPV